MAKGIYINTQNDGVKKVKKLWVNTGNGVKKVKKAWVCVSTDPLQVKLVYVAGYKYGSRVPVGSLEFITNKTYAGSIEKPGVPTDEGKVPSFSTDYIPANKLVDKIFYLKESIGTTALQSIDIKNASKNVYYSSSSGSYTDYNDVYTSYGGPGGYESEPPFDSSSGKYVTNGLAKYTWSWSSVLSHPRVYQVDLNNTRLRKFTYTRVEEDVKIQTSSGGYAERVGSEYLYQEYGDNEDVSWDDGFSHNGSNLSGYRSYRFNSSTGLYTLSNPTRIHWYCSDNDEEYFGTGEYVYWVGQEYENLPSSMTRDHFTHYWVGSVSSGVMPIYGQDYEIIKTDPTYAYADRYHYTEERYESKTYPYEVQRYEEKVIEGE